jgi:F0F1-type ATP synthase epsilon subunit
MLLEIVSPKQHYLKEVTSVSVPGVDGISNVK